MTVIPSNSVKEWKEFRAYLSELAKKKEWKMILEARRKATSDNTAPVVYEGVVFKSTAYFGKKTWISNDGKFFMEQLQDALKSLIENTRGKISFK